MVLELLKLEHVVSVPVRETTIMEQGKEPSNDSVECAQRRNGRAMMSRLRAQRRQGSPEQELNDHKTPSGYTGYVKQVAVKSPLLDNISIEASNHASGWPPPAGWVDWSMVLVISYRS
jgi:hypothetical protein